MGEIKVVEYHRGYAQGVADMWNHSHDGWGGGDTVRTSEDVERSESNSENTNLFLALEDEVVVGYCGLSEYRFDEDTMYIPLLNVRPSHHGKKIGKKLLLNALDKVIELGWPRLDLFTWAGNTKAVPLYKKCGFFWEDMDESTHLLNLIPTVLATEAVKDYFRHINWYDNSTRTIEVKPDGDKENKFEYYEYSWEKEETKLRVQFERRGRGLRLIETDDYLVVATVEKLNLVFGRKYQVEYKIINKSGKPLEISIEGVKDKNIDNTFSVTHLVTDEVIVSNKFTVGEITEEQSNFKTHPRVAAKIKINEKEALFQVGVIPEFPAKLELKGNKELCYLDKMGEFYLDIENNFDEAVKFKLNLPSTAFVTLHQNDVIVNLEAKERTSIPLNYTLKDFGFYYPNLEVKAVLGNGEMVRFHKELGYGFKGLNAKFYGEKERFWELYNDKYMLKIEKMDNWQIPTRQVDDGFITAHMPPKIGKPFYDEFAKIKPVDFKFYTHGGSAVLEYVLQSDKKKGLHLKTIHRLYSNGLLSTNYEIINKGYESDENIYLGIPILHNLERAVMPIKGEIVELNDSLGGEFDYWESKDLTENWMFAKSKSIPRGLCWPKDYEVEFKGWHLMLTTNLGVIRTGASVTTKPTYISVGAFSTWQEFRAFAMEEEQMSTSVTNEHITLNVNGGNPFVDNTFKVSAKEKKTSVLDGNISIIFDGKVHEDKIKADNRIKEVSFQLTPNKAMDYVNAQIDLAAYKINKSRIVFKKGNGQVKTSISEKEGHKVYTAENGALSIKAAPTFAPNLFSMEYQGKEWLDSSFPQVGPKSWWSPWQGGLYSKPDGLLLRAALKEKIGAEFVQIYDQFNNMWSGIKLTSSIKQHEKLRGLTYHQYYLMLPDLPILCQLVEIEQNTGTYLDSEWSHSYYLKPHEDLKSCFYRSQNDSGQWITNKAGVQAYDGTAQSTVTAETENEKLKLHVISDIKQKNMLISTNQEVMFLIDFVKFPLKNGETKKLQPNFFVLTEERINESALKDLLDLRF